MGGRLRIGKPEIEPLQAKNGAADDDCRGPVGRKEPSHRHAGAVTTLLGAALERRDWSMVEAALELLGCQ